MRISAVSIPPNRAEVGVRLFLSTLLGLLTVGCWAGVEGNSGGLEGWKVELRVAPTPPGVGDARVVVTVEGPEGLPPAGTLVELEGRLRHESQSTVMIAATPGRPGRYEVDAFPFSTTGEWLLTVRVTPPLGPLGEWTFPVRAVAAPQR